MRLTEICNARIEFLVLQLDHEPAIISSNVAASTRGSVAAGLYNPTQSGYVQCHKPKESEQRLESLRLPNATQKWC